MSDTDSTHIPGTNYHELDALYNEIKLSLESAEIEHDWVEIGRSAQGNPMYAACIGDGDFRKPELLYISGVHAMELIGPQMSLEIIRSISGIKKNSSQAEFFSKFNVWTIPCLNPDGYLRVQQRLKSPVAGIVYSRCNARGVDLNRNFPVAFYKHSLSLNPFAGSILPFSPYYHGKYPCSEPESKALRDFVLSRNIRISLDIHSFGNVIFHPYGYTNRKPRDEKTFIELARGMIARQKFKYRIKQAYSHYPTSGDICDWLYDEFGVLSMLIELGPLSANLSEIKTIINPFYWANPLDPQEIVQNALPACLYLMDALAERFA